MSSPCSLIKNTVKITDSCAEDLFTAGLDFDYWYKKSKVIDDNGMIDITNDYCIEHDIVLYQLMVIKI